ncbi:gloverin-like [Epargyreus clarus]|uniref:gloverin-like n=1 Tax=Epargyreus clarus TaxID=520877 RepID=UPI003C2DAAC7
MFSTQIVLAFAVIVCAYAQVSLPPGYKEKYPDTYKFSKKVRYPRDVSWDTQVGHGKVFGTLGNDETSLYGKAGYKGDIFNDHRGVLKGEAYGSRVLGATGDTSHLGGKLDWSNAAKTADAALHVNKQFGGATSVSGSASKVWNLDKNTHLSAGGAISQDNFGHGRPDYSVGAKFQHDW